ncbi:MAG: response regulator [Zetaproteobacteria bacterium]|nr:MAG: response regulator [Zetaproteobacteria bacterium]
MAPRVLVVEDNPVNLELVAALLENEGCGVLLAESADLGLRLAAAEHPDLIVMDIQLPRMSGYDATRRLKADPVTARIPVMALTAHAMRGDEARARAAGFDAFLTKPIDTRVFRETVRRFLGNRGGE